MGKLALAALVAACAAAAYVRAGATPRTIAEPHAAPAARSRGARRLSARDELLRRAREQQRAAVEAAAAGEQPAPVAAGQADTWRRANPPAFDRAAAQLGSSPPPPPPPPSPRPERTPPPPLPPPTPPAPALVPMTTAELAPLRSFCLGVATAHRCALQATCGHIASTGMACDKRTATCVCAPGACVDAQVGECRALDASTSVRARVWRSPPPSATLSATRSFPEAADRELERRTSNVGLALVGPGALSAAVAAGVLRGLHALSMLPHLRYLSASGGAAVAATAYLYADPARVPSDITLLGAFVPPEDISAVELRDASPSALVAAASADVLHEARAALDRAIRGAGAGARAASRAPHAGAQAPAGTPAGATTLDDVWTVAVSRALLDRFGLGDAGTSLGWNRGALDDFVSRNPRFVNASAHLPRALRPFLVLAASIVGPAAELPGLSAGNGDGGLWPEWAAAPHGWTPLHVTSVYTGAPATADARFTRAPNADAPDKPHGRGEPVRRPLAMMTGGYLENMAVGGGAAERPTWLPAGKLAGLVNVPMPTSPLSLAKVVAAAASRLSALLPAEAERRRQRELRAEQLEVARGPAIGETAAQWAARLQRQGTAHLAYEPFATTATWLDVLAAAAPRINYWSPAHALDEAPGASARAGATPEPSTSADVLLADANESPGSAIGALLLRGVREVIVPVVALTPLNVRVDPLHPTAQHVDAGLLSLFHGAIEPARGTSGVAATPAAALFEHGGLRPLLDCLIAAKLRGRAVACRVELATVASPRVGLVAGVRVNVTWIYVDRNFEWERRLGASRDADARALLATINMGNEVEAGKLCAHRPAACAFLRFPALQQPDALPPPVAQLGASREVNEEVVPGPPPTRYGDLLDERSAAVLGDAAVLSAAWTPLDRTVANAIASLVSFSVVSLEPLLYQVFTQRPMPPRSRARGGGGGHDDDDGAPQDVPRGMRPIDWVGCHADKPDAPQLPHIRGVGLNTELCARLCDGYPFFAMQGADAQCRCGVLSLRPTHSLSAGAGSDPYRKVDDRECGKPCAGETSLEPTRLCGGRQRNAIYRLFKPAAPASNVSRAAAASRAERDEAARAAGAQNAPAAPLAPLATLATVAWQAARNGGGAGSAAPRVGSRLEALPTSAVAVSYVGCATTPRGSVVLPYARGSGHTTTSCAAVCRHFSFFALSHAREWGECSCGDEVGVGTGSVALEGKCGDVCDGEEGQQPARFCGSRTASAVYQGAGCHDVPSWSNSAGYTCAEYERRGWCAHGGVLDAARGGAEQHHPEQACCACGRGSGARANASEATHPPRRGGGRAARLHGAARAARLAEGEPHRAAALFGALGAAGALAIGALARLRRGATPAPGARGGRGWRVERMCAITTLRVGAARLAGVGAGRELL